MDSLSSRAVFLSYASQDAEAAGRIAAALRAAGVEVWFDQSELRGGDAWDRKLRHQIRDCALFVAIVSKTTDSRLEGYFRREWRLAIERTRDMAEERPFLVPVVVDETSDGTRRVPERFHEVQWTRLPGGETPPAFVQQVQALLALIPDVAPAVSTDPPVRSGSMPPLNPESGTRIASGSNPGRLWRAAFVAAVVVLGGIVAVSWRGSWPGWRGGKTPELGTIAVVHDCQPGVPADVEMLGQSIVHNLTDGLCQLEQLSVVAHEVVARYGTKPLDFARLRAELGAEKLLTVSVRSLVAGSDGSRGGGAGRPDYEVRVSLSETRTHRHLWGDTFVRRSRDAADVVENVSRAVVEALQIGLNARDRTRLEAYRLSQKGRYHWDGRTGEALQLAVNCYEQAIRLVPDYAAAHAGLANCYSLLPYYGATRPTDAYPKARDAARRALKLDDSLAEAHAALGLVLRDYERDWRGAEREFRRAIELNPKYATALQWYAEYLAALGRHDESVEAMQRARNLAPLEPIVSAVLGWVEYLGGRSDQAIAVLAATVERHPEFWVAHWFLSLAEARKGQFDRAIPSALRAHELSRGDNRSTAALANLQARSGRRAEAERHLQQLKRQAGNGGHVSPYDFAVVEVGLGIKESAFDHLEQAVQGRHWEVMNLKVDPLLEPLRSEPRYTALVRKMGLPD